VSFYTNSQSNIENYFSIVDDLVYCKDVCEFMEELQLQHAAKQWRFFIDSSKVSLKAVLLHNGNKHPSVPLAHVVHINEIYAII
jgi:hypothetical protein